ncbi:LamG-like jellyroll fold domain-containing protein [Actinokineospora enzanensis]|uniref:LamG-like jellyroll fold domain-containing protein n=1 Tax=Actinokineospora enzanensis TaxID=155975 RepID=UPI00037458EA|nr:LamG-like jellyroll fold domain-containing protein [Actinokineospora enzanensis]
MKSGRRLAVLAVVLVAVAYLGTSSTISGYLARLVNTTDTVSSAPPDCHTMPKADGATRLYPLNETSGTTAVDESPSAANGVYQGGRQSTMASGYPCTRNAENNARVDQTHWISTSGTISISPTTSSSQEAWFRTVNSQGVICGFGNTQTGSSTTKSLLLSVTSTGRLAYLVAGTTSYELVSNFSVNDGAWHHVVGVHDSTFGVRVYFDGTLLMSQSGAHPSAFTAYYRIGYENTSGFTNGFGTDQSLAHFWDNLAFVAYYPFALSAAEVTGHYQAGGH